MRTPPTNWTTLMAQPHETETRIDIAGVSYYGYDGNSGIWSCETRPMLFDKLSVGNCCSAQIDLVLSPTVSHWWLKKRIAYTWAVDTGIDSAKETYRLYKHMKTTDDLISPEVLCGGNDYIDATPEQVNDALVRGYCYHYEEGMGVYKIVSFTLGQDEWTEEYELYVLASLNYSPEDVAIEGPYIETVSASSESAHPTYGIADGHWWVYDGERASEIPTMAKMELYVRLTNGTLTTDWVRKGIYYIDTREWDAQHTFLTITGYDAMLKTEQDYFTPPVTITGWPKTDTAVVSEICTRIGVELDTRTVLNKGYMVQVPAVSSDGSDSDTLREVLGWIGAMYGGNWCITDEGKLRLVPLVPTQTVAVGTDALDLTTTPAYEPIGVVHLVVSEDAEYVAGTSGRSIEISCPWGTRAMASNILTAIGGYVYQPLTVTTATEANPLWELGDGATVNGYTSVIASMPTAFGLKYTADIEAPESEEINHEYPYQDKGTRQIDRKIAKTSASLRVDVDRISSEVRGKVSSYRQASEPASPHVGDLWYCTSELTGYEKDTWYRWSGADWDKTANEASVPMASGWIDGAEYRVSDMVDFNGAWYVALQGHTASQTNMPPNTAYWEHVTKISAATKSQITQTMDHIELSVTSTGTQGTKISLSSGDVTVNSPSVDLYVKSVNISGKLTADQINTTGLLAEKIYVLDRDGDPIFYADATIGSVSMSSAHIFGPIQADSLSANAVITNGITLNGLLHVEVGGETFGYVGGMTGLESGIGGTLTGPNLQNFIVATDSAAKISYHNSKNIWVASGGCYSSETMQVYSDRVLKQNIMYDLGKFDSWFDKLRPCEFAYRSSSERQHFGLIAQDVLEAFWQAGFDASEYSVVGCDSQSTMFSIGYGELIAVCIAQIQKLKARVKDLETAS